MTEELNRSTAQFFFEIGFGNCFAEAMIRNDMKPPFEFSDALVEGAWPRAIEAHEDGAEMDRYLKQAEAADRLAHLPTDLSEDRAMEVLKAAPWPGADDKFGMVPVPTALRAMQQYAAGLQGENAKLREALEFYADRDHDGYAANAADYGLSVEVGDIIKDGGQRARTALGDTQ